MLLFVIEADLQPLLQGRPDVVAGTLQQRQHVFVHIRPVTDDVVDARTRQKSPLLAGMEFSDPLIIGIEQIAEPGMEFRIARLVGLQQEGLEEPARMRQMPFGRTGLGRDLDHIILARQRCAQRFALLSHVQIDIRPNAALFIRQCRHRIGDDHGSLICLLECQNIAWSLSRAGPAWRRAFRCTHCDA